MAHDSLATQSACQARSGRVRLWIAATLMAGACVGCGSQSKVAITGKVTLQGKPVTSGMVAMDDGKGAHLVAPLNSNGEFAIENSETIKIPEGSYQVAVLPPKADFPVDPTQMATAPKADVNVPMKYRDSKTSQITLEVKEGDNALEIDMTP
jgi:hypothetical protein